MYGSAFRAPLFLERNYGFYEATGNEDLRPEKIEQSEASIEYEIGKWLQVKGRYFYWETEVGGTYQGISLTLAVFNVFENAMVYDMRNDNYIKGERIVRVNVEYTYKF